MSEKILGEILAEICEEEISSFNYLPQFKPSLRHKLAMKRIFTLFEKNSHNIINTSQTIPHSRHTHLSLRKRLIIVFILIVCAALLTGFIYSYVSKNFHGTVYIDNTQLFAINLENCPKTIEYEYYLSVLPDGFEVIEHDSSTTDIYTKYRNILSEQEVIFIQCTKEMFDTHYNTEKHDFEEIEINGHSGLCIDFSDIKHNSSTIIWDNDDYILEIKGNLSKKDLIVLAESAKVLKK